MGVPSRCNACDAGLLEALSRVSSRITRYGMQPAAANAMTAGVLFHARAIAKAHVWILRDTVRHRFTHSRALRGPHSLTTGCASRGNGGVRSRCLTGSDSSTWSAVR